MKRIFTIVIVALSALLGVHRPASAMVEACPASLAYAPVVSTAPSPGVTPAPSDLYGFDLSALSQRTITSAVLAFDTSAGWYGLSLGPVDLKEQDRHYNGPSSHFVLHDYVSAPMYVTFPQALTINHAWVLGVNAQDQGVFQWQGKGLVACAPTVQSPTVRSAALQVADTMMGSSYVDTGHDEYVLDPKDRNDLGAPPIRSSAILSAAPTDTLLTPACSQPFRSPAVKKIMAAQFPGGSGTTSMSNTSNELTGADIAPNIHYPTRVEVALDASGNVTDAWVWGPSGVRSFDDEALRAAKLTTYTGALAYCRPVPSTLFFQVDFQTNPD